MEILFPPLPEQTTIAAAINAGPIGENSPPPRITSRAEFAEKLGATVRRLLCALIHKFTVADLQPTWREARAELNELPLVPCR